MFCEIKVIAEIYRRYQLDDIYDLCFQTTTIPQTQNINKQKLQNHQAAL